jgi:hypothetical protein
VPPAPSSQTLSLPREGELGPGLGRTSDRRPTQASERTCRGRLLSPRSDTLLGPPGAKPGARRLIIEAEKFVPKGLPSPLPRLATGAREFDEERPASGELRQCGEVGSLEFAAVVAASR